MKLSQFKQDVTSAEEGQWVDIGNGAAVKVRRIGCKAYSERTKQLLKPYPPKTRNSLPDAVWEEILCKVAADVLLVDWRGVIGDDDKPIQFSHDKAYELFKDPAYRDFYELITSLANEAETFRKEDIDVTSGE